MLKFHSNSSTGSWDICATSVKKGSKIIFCGKTVLKTEQKRIKTNIGALISLIISIILIFKL